MEWDKNAPVITEETKRSKSDKHEILLDNSEISEDESLDDMKGKEHDR